MKRKIYDKLIDWKKNDSRRTALLIDGARRVGKSYIAEEFAKSEYKSHLIIDFNRAGNDLKDIFERYLDDLDTFFTYLSAYYGIRLYERESLIIFDEVQMFPKARSAIKYLVADGRYDYLETGSLMSIKANVGDIVIPSEERHIKMYPLDFEEFLWATKNDGLMPIISKCFSEKKPLGQTMHRKVMDIFRQYLIVGGMPQAVNEYIDTKDFERVDQVKRDILTLYRADITKYAKSSQLQKHEKKFNLASISKEARFREYEDAMFWLSDAMIANICYNSTAPNVGLKLNMDRMTLKCYMSDTGLLISHAFDENSIVSEALYKKLLFGTLEINEGMITENIVAQMLRTAGHDLYFYSNSNREDVSERMEIDFLVAKSKVTSRHNVSPIEVKSGKKYALTSMRKFIKKFGEQLHTPYVLHSSDLRKSEGIVYLPLYMAGLL